MTELAYIGPETGDRDAVLATLTAQHWPVIAVDTETINTKNQTIICIGLAYGPHRLYIQTFPELCDAVPQVMHMIASPNITKVYHNVFFDYRALAELAYDEGFAEPDLTNIADTSLMAKVSGHSASLDEVSGELLNYHNEYSIKELLAEAGRGSTMLDVPFEKTAAKCLNDVYATRALYDKFQLTEAMKDCYDVDIKMARLLLHMEKRGLALHQPMLVAKQEYLKREMLRLSDICAAEGFNPGSGQQVGYVLASRGNILPFTKSRRQLRTDEEALEELDDSLAQTVLDYRKSQKLLGTYVEPWIGQDRAYTKFRMDLSTGRLASFDRNLQNIPPDMRAVFKPDKDVFSWMDLSQIELRVLANLSHDKELLAAFAQGISPHELTCQEFWPGASKDSAEYLRAKTFNFAMVYDASIPTLAKRTKITREQATSLRGRWLSLYSGVAEFMRERSADPSLYAESLYGRRMLLPTIDGLKRDTPYPKPDRAYQSHIDKVKINYVIQGTAADIMKRVALKIAEDNIDSRLQVHDEWVVDGYYHFPDELENICPDFKTPFSQYFGATWR